MCVRSCVLACARVSLCANTLAVPHRAYCITVIRGWLGGAARCGAALSAALSAAQRTVKLQGMNGKERISKMGLRGTASTCGVHNVRCYSATVQVGDGAWHSSRWDTTTCAGSLACVRAVRDVFRVHVIYVCTTVGYPHHTMPIVRVQYHLSRRYTYRLTGAAHGLRSRSGIRKRVLGHVDSTRDGWRDAGEIYEWKPMDAPEHFGMGHGELWLCEGFGNVSATVSVVRNEDKN